MEDGEGREEGEREKTKKEPLEDGEMYEEEGEICVIRGPTVLLIIDFSLYCKTLIQPPLFPPSGNSNGAPVRMES